MIGKVKLFGLVGVGALAVGMAIGSAGTVKWYTEKEVARAQAQFVQTLTSVQAASRDALEARTRIHKAELALANERVQEGKDVEIVTVDCKLPRGTVGMLNLSRTGTRGGDTAGGYSQGDAAASSIGLQREVRAHAECGRKYRTCALAYKELYDRVKAANERNTARR